MATTIRELVTKLGFKVDNEKLKKYGQAAGKAAIATAGIGIAIAAVGFKLIQGAGEIEQIRIAFETMTGSAEVAGKLLKDITQFAAKTPFQLKELFIGTKKLLAFGFAADEIIDKMTVLGNIASGVGRNKMPNLILAFGKIRAKGKATMEELNILLEAGVPILDELAKNMGVNTSEIIRLTSRGKIGFKAVDEALTSLGSGTGKFGGLMEKQSKSFLGILSNIADFFTNLGNAIGKKLLPAAKFIAKAFLDFAEANERFVRINIVGFFKKIILGIVFMIGFLQGFTSEIGKTTKSFIDMDKVMGAVKAIFGAVQKIFGKLKDGFVTILPFIIDVVKEIASLGQALFDSLGITEAFNENTEEGVDAFAVFFDIIKGGLKLLKFLIRIIKQLVIVLKPVFRALKDISAILSDMVLDFFRAFEGVEDLDISEIFELVKEAAKKIWSDIVDIVKQFLKDMRDDIEEFFRPMVTTVQDIWNSIVSVFETSIDKITGFFGGIFDAAFAAINPILLLVGGTFDKILTKIENALSKIGNFFSNEIRNIKRDLELLPFIDFGIREGEKKALGRKTTKADIENLRRFQGAISSFAGRIAGGTQNNVNVRPVINVQVAPGTTSAQAVQLSEAVKGGVSSAIKEAFAETKQSRPAVESSPGVGR